LDTGGPRLDFNIRSGRRSKTVGGFAQHNDLKTFFKTLATVVDRAIWMVGCFTIMNFTKTLWPFVYQIFVAVFLVGFGVWYVWKCILQPFREGLRG
jgi:hypothetical protein